VRNTVRDNYTRIILFVSNFKLGSLGGLNKTQNGNESYQSNPLGLPYHKNAIAPMKLHSSLYHFKYSLYYIIMYCLKILAGDFMI